jgi:hypothetical protein
MAENFIRAEFIHALYCAFLKAPPFNQLLMPEPEEVYCYITDDKTIHGGMAKDRHYYQIHISKATCEHLNNVIMTLLHEMVHVHFLYRGDKVTYATHDLKFRRLANRICKIYKFDKGSF